MVTELLLKEPVTARKKTARIEDAEEIFPVTGMTCASCAMSVESSLKSLTGVQEATVNFASQTTRILFDPTVTNSSIFQKTIRDIGYDLIIQQENKEVLQQEALEKAYRSLKRRTIGAVAFSIPIVLIGMFFMNLPYANRIMLVLSVPVMFFFGKSFFINAWKQAKHGKANMDTLVAVSTGSAWLFSVFNTLFPQYWISRGLQPHVYFEAATVVIAFISIGKLLEERAKARTSTALRKLIGLQSRIAHVVRGDEQLDIPVQDLKTGDILIVKPGEKIPVDGQVISGMSYVEESTITGEPLPAKKTKDSPVFAGTINQKGSFQFVAQKLGADTLLGQIIKMVQTAQGSKAPVQKLVDRISGIFVPVVIVISLLTFVIWILSGGPNAFSHGLLAAVTVLVIACPCALGLATPTAIMVAVGKGADSNILIRDAESLEMARKVNVVVLDKTGTITEGRPQVTDMVFIDPESVERDKTVLLALEMHSEHPLAASIIHHLVEERTKPVIMEGFESITGKGVRGYFLNDLYAVGNNSLTTDLGVRLDSTWESRVKDLQTQGKTVVYFSKNNVLIGIIAITDPVKPGSRAAVQALQNQGIEVYMLTGDDINTAETVASQVGLRHFKAGILPQEKADFIQFLQQSGKVVAMVGDGINDSQALAIADMSMAMGKGSDIAMDVAQMTIIGSDLKNISKALRLSRDTVRTIRQNLFWAFIYNLIGIPVAAGILYPINGFLLSPMIAGAAMALSSVSVVSNSLRLKHASLN
jgi:P-type Cu2+ transporter